MKLLIDIPEHVYEHAKEMTEDSRDEGEAMRAIANGSPARAGRMNEEEKERLIKKDIAMIENKVRHAFNQGYEMGVKKSRSEKPNTCSDAISRKYILDLIDTKGANLDDDLLIVAQWIQDAPSVNPHPIECGDAISRQAAVNAIYDLCGENVSLKENPLRDNPHMDAVVDALENLSSVTPQQRTGRWIEVIDETDSLGNKTWHHECSICGSDKSGWGTYKHCPDCGAKMEVEDAD